MNTLPCDVARCGGENCDLKQYCARYTAPTKKCVQVSYTSSSYCIENNNIEFRSNGNGFTRL